MTIPTYGPESLNLTEKSVGAPYRSTSTQFRSKKRQAEQPLVYSLNSHRIVLTVGHWTREEKCGRTLLCFKSLLLSKIRRQRLKKNRLSNPFLEKLLANTAHSRSENRHISTLFLFFRNLTRKGVGKSYSLWRTYFSFAKIVENEKTGIYQHFFSSFTSRSLNPTREGVGKSCSFRRNYLWQGLESSAAHLSDGPCDRSHKRRPPQSHVTAAY